MEKEMTEVELDNVRGGAPKVKATTIVDELSVEDLDKIKAGLSSMKLAYEENAKSEAFAEKRNELLRQKEELESMQEGPRLH